MLFASTNGAVQMDVVLGALSWAVTAKRTEVQATLCQTDANSADVSALCSKTTSSGSSVRVSELWIVRS